MRHSIAGTGPGSAGIQPDKVEYIFLKIIHLCSRLEAVRMIFFNPKTEKYDTLASNYLLTVTGESKKNESF